MAAFTPLGGFGPSAGWSDRGHLSGIRSEERAGSGGDDAGTGVRSVVVEANRAPIGAHTIELSRQPPVAGRSMLC
jgi:hypothetical protein